MTHGSNPIKKSQPVTPKEKEERAECCLLTRGRVFERGSKTRFCRNEIFTVYQSRHGPWGDNCERMDCGRLELRPSGHAAMGDEPWPAASANDVGMDEIQLLETAQNRRRPIE